MADPGFCKGVVGVIYALAMSGTQKEFTHDFQQVKKGSHTLVLHSSLLATTSYLPRDCSLLGVLVKKRTRCSTNSIVSSHDDTHRIFVRHTLIHTSKHLSVHASEIILLRYLYRNKRKKF